MNRKLSSLALAAVLAGSGLPGCGGGMSGVESGTTGTITDALAVSAKEMDPHEKTDTDRDRQETASRFLSFLNQLRQVPALTPLFDLFHVPDPIVADDDDDEAAGLIDLLHAVRFAVCDGTLTISNRATGGIIFTAPRRDLAAGVFHPENLPGTPPPTGGGTCTSFTYSSWSACSAAGQMTRTVLSSSPAGCTGGSPVTTQACTPPPPGGGTCTAFTYSAWSACSATTSTQTRTVLSSAPAGCTGGSPVTSQACTPALDGAALYTATCSGCHGRLATSNLKGKNISLALIYRFNMQQGLTDPQLQAIVTAVGP